MAIMVITGELGSGKTLSLTYLAWRNWYLKKKIIFANYKLYGIPYLRITRVSELDMIRNGYLCADEMWVWLESCAGERLKKKIIADILRRSRKRSLTVNSTSQTLDQIPPRIRKILDFIGYPVLNRSATICKLLIFAGPKGRSLLKTHYFYTEPVFKMYDTNEEVSDLIDDVTESWNKPYSRVSHLKYMQSMSPEVNLQNPQPLNPAPEVQLKVGELIKNMKPITVMKLPKPEIKFPSIKTPNITLRDAEGGAVGFEEEEEILESKKDS